MAMGKTLVGGTAYDTTEGKTLVGGTAYTIKMGKTLVGGTAYDIGSVKWAKYAISYTSSSWSYLVNKSDGISTYTLSNVEPIVFESWRILNTGEFYWDGGYADLESNGGSVWLQAADGGFFSMSTDRKTLYYVGPSSSVSSVSSAKLTWRKASDTSIVITANVVKLYVQKKVIKETMGAYIETVSGADGDYPDNGIQDGYWYVKE